MGQSGSPGRGGSSGPLARNDSHRERPQKNVSWKDRETSPHRYQQRGNDQQQASRQPGTPRQGILLRPREPRIEEVIPEEEHNTGSEPRLDHHPPEVSAEIGHREVREPDRATLIPRGKAEAMKAQKQDHARAQDPRRPENLPWWMKQRMAKRAKPAWSEGQGKGKGKDKGKNKGKGHSKGKDRGKE